MKPNIAKFALPSARAKLLRIIDSVNGTSPIRITDK